MEETVLSNWHFEVKGTVRQHLERKQILRWLAQIDKDCPPSNRAVILFWPNKAIHPVAILPFGEACGYTLNTEHKTFQYHIEFEESVDPHLYFERQSRIVSILKGNKLPVENFNPHAIIYAPWKENPSSVAIIEGQQFLDWAIPGGLKVFPELTAPTAQDTESSPADAPA